MDITRGKLSLQHVPATWPCNMYPSVWRPLLAEGEVHIAEYLPRQSRGKYSEKQMWRQDLGYQAKKSYNYRARGDYNAEFLYSPLKI